MPQTDRFGLTSGSPNFSNFNEFCFRLAIISGETPHVNLAAGGLNINDKSIKANIKAPYLMCLHLAALDVAESPRCYV